MSSIDNWREEMQSAHLYRLLARRETDDSRRRMFLGLADAAERQAKTWAALVAEEGGSVPERLHVRPRVRVVEALVRVLGPRAIRPMLAAMKVRGLSAYSSAAPATHPMPRTLSDFGDRHRSIGGGGNLRAAVFGVSDGLVSNASLIMGMAGATDEPHVVVLSGMAGLLAGALSMGAGEWVSVRSQRELYEYQIGLERDELAQYPEEETEEMALIYEARGLELGQARQVARTLMADPEAALDLLAREELGLNPDDLGSPWGAALSSGGAFTVGAAVPLLPFLLIGGQAALALSAAAAALGLFAVGAVLSLFTGRGALGSGARMLLIGAAAGLAAHGLGRLIGIGLG